MNEDTVNGLTLMFWCVGFIYMAGNTTNPIGYIALLFSTWMIYRLLKKEEQREIANR